MWRKGLWENRSSCFWGAWEAFPQIITEWNHGGKKSSPLGKVGENSPLSVRESPAPYHNMRPFGIWSLELSQIHPCLFPPCFQVWPDSCSFLTCTLADAVLSSWPAPQPSDPHPKSLVCENFLECFSFPSGKDQ